MTEASTRQGSYVEHARVHIHYEVHGDGPPLLLHHGFPSCAEHWRVSGYVERCDLALPVVRAFLDAQPSTR